MNSIKVLRGHCLMMAMTRQVTGSRKKQLQIGSTLPQNEGRAQQKDHSLFPCPSSYLQRCDAANNDPHKCGKNGRR